MLMIIHDIGAAGLRVLIEGRETTRIISFYQHGPVTSAAGS
jgi:hypothetical protein